MAHRNNKVLFPYVGDSVGGSHHSSLLLASALRNIGFESVIGTHKANDRLSEVASRFNLSPVYLPPVEAVCLMCSPSRRTQAIRRNLSQLAPFLMSNDIDIVHTNDQRMHLAWQAPTCRTRKQHVWHQRSSLLGKRMGIIARWLGMQAVKSDAVIAVSDFCRSSFPASVQSKVRVVYNAIVVDSECSLRSDPRELWPLTHGGAEARIIWVANWTNQKRPKDFVKMATLARKWGLRASFLMVGEPGSSNQWRTRRVLEVGRGEPNLRIAGYRHDAASLVAESDILIATSCNEGLGRTLVEAMLSETLVIASDSGGHREVVIDRENGRLYRLGDVSEAVSILCEAIDDNEARGKMIAQGKRIHSKFSVDQHLEAVVAVYDSLMKPKSNGM